VEFLYGLPQDRFALPPCGIGGGESKEQTALGVFDRIGRSGKGQPTSSGNPGLAVGFGCVLLGDLCLFVGLIGAIDGEQGGTGGDCCEDKECDCACLGGAYGAAVLPDLLGFQLVLGDTSNRRGDIGHCGREPRVVQVELLLGAGKPEVHPARLVGEGPV